MRLIFLDIDGVLNTNHTTTRWGKYRGLDSANVKIFKDMMSKTDAKIILSSTWRLKREDCDHVWEVLGEDLKARCIGHTPENKWMIGQFDRRGCEISGWFEENQDDYDESKIKWIILDDDPGILENQKSHFFQTDEEKGLTEKIAQKVLEYLNS